MKERHSGDLYICMCVGVKAHQRQTKETRETIVRRRLRTSSNQSTVVKVKRGKQGELRDKLKNLVTIN